MRSVRGNLTRYFFFSLHPVQRAQTASKLAKGHVIIIQPKDIEIIDIKCRWLGKFKTDDISRCCFQMAISG